MDLFVPRLQQCARFGCSLLTLRREATSPQLWQKLPEFHTQIECRLQNTSVVHKQRGCGIWLGRLASSWAVCLWHFYQCRPACSPLAVFLAKSSSMRLTSSCVGFGSTPGNLLKPVITKCGDTATIRPTMPQSLIAGMRRPFLSLRCLLPRKH